MIFVVDCSDQQRMEDAVVQFEAINRLEELPESVPLLIYANKQDLCKKNPSCSISPEQLTDQLNLHSLKRAWKIQQSTAVTGEGIQEGLDWLCRYYLGVEVKKSGLKRLPPEKMKDHAPPVD